MVRNEGANGCLEQVCVTVKTEAMTKSLKPVSSPPQGALILNWTSFGGKD